MFFRGCCSEDTGLHRHAAVDAEHLARDVARQVAREEQHRAGNLLRLAHAPQRPAFERIRKRPAALRNRKGPFRFVSRTVSQSSSFRRRSRLSRVTPALLTRMSRPPSAAAAFSTVASISAGLETSHLIAIAPLP